MGVSSRACWVFLVAGVGVSSRALRSVCPVRTNEFRVPQVVLSSRRQVVVRPQAPDLAPAPRFLPWHHGPSRPALPAFARADDAPAHSPSAAPSTHLPIGDRDMTRGRDKGRAFGPAPENELRRANVLSLYHGPWGLLRTEGPMPPTAPSAPPRPAWSCPPSTCPGRWRPSSPRDGTPRWPG